jgi:hypothetical protein
LTADSMRLPKQARGGGFNMNLLTDIEVKTKFGKFEYKSNSNGSITILNDWAKQNIVRSEIPIVGYVQCHKEIMFDLYRIFNDIEKYGLTAAVDIHDTKLRGGSYVPRHKCWNPKRGLSRHSWGIAYDINPTKNCYGCKPVLHEGIVAIFKSYGFLWGGNWTGKNCDPMHFEVSDEWRAFHPIIYPIRLNHPDRDL